MNSASFGRLRAALRLCFAPEQADALAVRMRCDEADLVRALAPVMRLARVNYTGDRWLAPFTALRRSSDRARPLRPRPGVPALPALALALHLGLNLDIDTLTEIFGSAENTIATALQDARRAVDPNLTRPCAGFDGPVGRYRDPVVDRLEERLAFMQHLATCKRCQLALDQARQIDNELLADIAQQEAALPANVAAGHAGGVLWLGPVLLWGGLSLVAVVLVLAGIVGTRRLLAPAHAPVPLRSSSAPAPALNGWLIQSTESGDVSAVNVATGEQRLLIPGQADNQADEAISPDGTRIAQLTNSPGTGVSLALHAYAIDGTVQREWDGFAPTGQDQLLGWLNTTTILVSRTPIGVQSETATQYHERIRQDGRLLAFDVVTGNQQTLLNGWITAASASPDRHYLAIDRNLGDNESGLEIRPITGTGLGAPVATFAQAGSALSWTEGNHLVFWARTASGGEVDTIALDGTVTRLYQSGIGFIPTMLGLSPDGKRMIYATTLNPGWGLWSYWQMKLNDGTTQKLVDAGTGYAAPGSVVWSPGGMLALAIGQPFYLPHPQQGSTQTGVDSIVTVTFDASGHPAGTLLDELATHAPIAWVPESALPSVVEPQRHDAGTFHTTGIAKQNVMTPQLTADSRVSPDDSKALVYDQTYNVAMAVPLNSDAPEQIGGVPLDASWLPDSSGSIGVQPHSVNGGSTSRITLYGSSMVPVDYDPAQLGASTTESYRYPMLAPNGLRYSFFVVGRQTVALWVGGYAEPPRAITSWTLPPDAGVNVPLVARWIANDVLIFTEPESWHDGLPQRVTLRRLTVSATGTTIDPLISWQPHGNERGIVVQELRLSADQTEIAVRLRHISGADPSKDTFDSIEVAGSDDLRQSFELTRGSSGDGLSWSPDGTEIAAVINGGLEILALHGGQIEQVSTGGTVSYPLWVRPNEIWYESSDGKASEMLRATR